MTINPDAAFGASMAAMAIMGAMGKEPPEWMKILSFGSSLVALGYNLSRLQDTEQQLAQTAEMAGLGCPPTCPCDPCTQGRYLANQRYNWYR